VSVMDHGVVLESGPPAQIFDAPQHPRTREFLQAVTLRDSSAITDRSTGADISR
jgi:ABC-type glutathione transport system ATPase component